MTVLLEHDPFLDAVADLRRAADLLLRTRADVDRRVDVLLDGGWSGRAADCYRSYWDGWCRGSDAVLDAMQEMVELLLAARHDLAAGDEASRGRLDRIAGRMLGGAS